MADLTRLRTGLRVAVLAVLLAGIAVLVAPPEQAAPPAAGQQAAAPAPQASARSQADAKAIEAVLERRAQAVRDRDEKGFLATVDPQAKAAFVEKQADTFGNLAGIEFDEWSYLVSPEDAVDPAKLPAVAGADQVWAPKVDLRYALHGVDGAPTNRPAGYLFVRRGTSWYLRSDTELDHIGRQTWRGPWEFGRCRILTAQHGFVLYHPGSEPTARKLAAELDTAVAAVDGVWGTAWSQRVALLLPDSPTEMKAQVGPNFPIESVVAVAIADRVDRAEHRVEGQRVVLNPAGARGLSLTALRVVLRHEITHLATRADTVDGAPLWVLEGFADYIGYRNSGLRLKQGAPDLASAVRKGKVPDRLPQNGDFQARGDELDLAYQQAWSIHLMVRDRFGEETVVKLYRTIAAAGAVPAERTDQLLRELIGMDSAELLAAWRTYLPSVLR